MNRFNEARTLAETVNNQAGYRWWRVNGPILHKIAKLLTDHMLELVPQAAQNEFMVDYLTGFLVYWDNQFGWDAPHMDETTEDFFYETLVRFYLGLEITK